MQILYEMDLAGMPAREAVALFWQNLGQRASGSEFADELVLGFAEHCDEVDETIRRSSRHWRLERMARVDRNIIRLATFELMYCPDVPARVTLNEAIELAKRFGDEHSPAFVNGVLDRIAAEHGGA